ncbi:FeoC-like transcriptional regulator [Photobacterium sp. GB-36]|uniref:FeoC-like transcriptional regulator n=1 Tax=Photobacterium sp. GB-36 TaxID=2022108 RepID=UPI000D17B35A|nr:FeoC-like transcriptional regulator [Photobacterium sp. GB-36]PSV43465.1 hypothetical protein C9J46_11760 [Photobacterium sp. GB-36]
MISLITVRNTVRDAKIISFSQLTKHLKCEPKWLSALLDELILRGKVEKCDSSPSLACGKHCQNCQTQTTDPVYKWCENKIAISLC